MSRTIHEVLMALHTIPTKMEGDNPMDRIANAEAEIEQHVIKARIEELEIVKEIPGKNLHCVDRIAELKRGLNEN